jgi:hypothetical protein
MAEMVGRSRELRRPNGVIGGFLAALKSEWRRLRWQHREPRLRVEEWSDYLLKDVGLDRKMSAPTDPRDLTAGWKR